ncbi:Yip1 family protein [Parvibaculum sp.]|uniref:Yip1 family protein n=1 Tax=Parvibaculum sp. TaxID=2024848 RepID=UPI002CC4CE6D|nr:Yip1 family protein [Parvibaculum sp.]HUD52246.1 Yip1 family protein [Parvibaculum sp.]
MTTFEQPNAASIIDRAKNIILTPDTEWSRIDVERPTVQSLYTSYVMILAAIPPVAGAIGGVVFGYGAMGYTFRLSIGGAIAGAIVQYVLALIMVGILALVIEQLAPTFNGSKDRIQAFKVAAYSMTASWLAGIFSIVPALGFLSILGLYSLYLLYRGLPKLMKSPQDKSLAYAALVVVAGIVLMIIVGLVAAPFMHRSMMGTGAGM